MSFISTYDILSSRGWQIVSGGEKYILLASTTSNIAVNVPEALRMSYDGTLMAAIGGFGNANIFTFTVNSNNIISTSAQSGNAYIAGAGELAFAKTTKDVIVVSSAISDVGGHNRGGAWIIGPNVTTGLLGTDDNQRFGANVACNETGNIVAIMDASPVGLGIRNAFIYSNDANGAVLRETITPYAPAFTASSYMDDTGNILVTSDWANTELVIYTYNGNTWNNSNVALSNTSGLSQFFGSSIIINGSGDTIALVDGGATTSSNNLGRMYIFKNISNTWTEYQQLDCPNVGNTSNVSNLYLGDEIGISKNGSIITYPVENSGSLGIAVFENISNNYILRDWLNPTTIPNTNYFQPVDTNDNGNKIGLISYDVPLGNTIYTRVYST